MSTSTYVSRAEEMSRMKDLEDSFEDRYGKLKQIALKYKKKMAEQSKIIEELQKSLASKPKVGQFFLSSRISAIAHKDNYRHRAYLRTLLLA